MDGRKPGLTLKLLVFIKVDENINAMKKVIGCKYWG
jgi:hypothetical protein